VGGRVGERAGSANIDNARVIAAGAALGHTDRQQA